MCTGPASHHRSGGGLSEGSRYRLPCTQSGACDAATRNPWPWSGPRLSIDSLDLDGADYAHVARAMDDPADLAHGLFSSLPLQLLDRAGLIPCAEVRYLDLHNHLGACHYITHRNPPTLLSHPHHTALLS